MRRTGVTASLLVLTTCLVFPASRSTAQQTPEARTLYFIDPSHSSIEFTVPFMGISKVSGSFNQFYGTVDHDPANPASATAEVVIRVASIDTRNTKRDDDLRSESYFDVAAFPAMTFRSRQMRIDAETPTLIGDLTIRDVTREVALPFRILGSMASPEGRQMGIEATTTIDRREFGISQGQLSGDQVFIGNEVTIQLLLRLREPAAEKRRMAIDHPAVGTTADASATWVGRYRDNARGWELTVLRLNEELALERVGTLLRMIPIGKARFRLQDFAAFVSFQDEAAGRVLVFERPGREPQRYVATSTD